MTASLYGVENSNRNFADPHYWGKNQFNSSFPVALACYMRDRGVPLVYLLDDGDGINISEISVENVFGTTLANSDIFFSFESRFDPYECFVHDSLKAIDLVTLSASDNTPLRPLEIKLTTLPDSTTCESGEDEYGCELVVRNPTTRYMALSMVAACQNSMGRIREILEPVCHRIRDWSNVTEVESHIPYFMNALNCFLAEFHQRQTPILMQPVWKTVGKSAELADHCLDIFIWSDFALARMIMDLADVDRSRITRHQRAAIRLIRFLYEASTRGKVFQGPIYDGMTYDTLNDKEFSVAGIKTNTYMRCQRLTKPAIHKDEIKNIILGGGQRFLSPERRFDAIIFYSSELFDDDNDV